MWAAKAWTDTAEIRYISLTQTPELAQAIKMTGPVEMRVFFEGNEYLKTNDIATMKQWWDNRSYKKDDTPTLPSTSSDAPADPLASK